MKRLGLAAVLLGSVSFASAGTPPTVQKIIEWGKMWTWDESSKSWKWTAEDRNYCAKNVQAAVDAGVADTLVVDVEYDTPEFKKGKVTFKQLKESCLHAERTSAVYGLLSWFRNASNNPKDDVIADACMRAYAETINVVPASSTLPYEGLSFNDPATGSRYVGTLESAKAKFCEPLFAARKAELAKEEEPYRKVLKADKLELGLEHRSFYLAGKVVSGDPAVLAKANVWFREV